MAGRLLSNQEYLSRISHATAIITGELRGSATATSMPNISCKTVVFKAVGSNTGKVYIGASASVSKPDGTSDLTTGWELYAKEQTPPLFVDNVNRFWRISDNAGDDLVFLALR